MSSRALTTLVVAGALLTAVPALAAQREHVREADAAPAPVPARCERCEAELHALTARVQAAEKKAADAERPAEARPTVPQRPSVLDESW